MSTKRSIQKKTSEDNSIIFDRPYNGFWRRYLDGKAKWSEITGFCMGIRW